jgi:hypothetical protein
LPPLATRLQSSPDIRVYPHVVAFYRMTEVSFVGHGFAGGPPNAASQEKSGVDHARGCPSLCQPSPMGYSL